jgi:hypothetical protein
MSRVKSENFKPLSYLTFNKMVHFVEGAKAHLRIYKDLRDYFEMNIQQKGE